MIAIFYRRNGRLVVSQSETELSKLNRDDVLWIDLLSPTGEEKHTVDDFLGEEIQSRAQAEEIESSSRYSETENAIFANTNFLMPGPEDYSMEAVSFTFVDNCLTTLRDVPLRSFTELQRRIIAKPHLFPNGYNVFVSIMDQRVDLDADMIELMSKEIAQYSKRINQQEDINEDFLLDINQLQENTMIVRENIIDKQRLISNMIKSDKYPPELHPSGHHLPYQSRQFQFREAGVPAGDRPGTYQPGPEQHNEDFHPGVGSFDASDTGGQFLRHERAPSFHGEGLGMALAASFYGPSRGSGPLYLPEEENVLIFRYFSLFLRAF